MSPGRVRSRTAPHRFFAAALAAAMASGLFVVMGETPAFAAFTGTAHSLLSSALQSAQAAGSLQFISQTKVGKAKELVAGIISAPAASEAVSGVQTPFQVELVNGIVYVRAGASTLESALKLTATQASKLAGGWVSVTQKDSAFGSLTQALTITDALNPFVAAKNLTAEPEKVIDGHKVIPLVGRPTLASGTGASGSAALFVSAKHTHLPLGGTLVVSTNGQTEHEVATFKNWGAKVKVTAPTTATTVLTVVEYSGP